MKYGFVLLIMFLIPISANAAIAPFELAITGDRFDSTKTLKLSDVGEGATEINFDFKDTAGNQYNFDLQYKALPDNRSYPTNLDITIKDQAGEKLGYLFWANNGIDALQRIGVFGLVIDIEGSPVDFRFTFDMKTSGSLRVADLDEERFVQDTLVSKHGFQMIRPVLVPLVSEGLRSQSYALDDHPYSVNYTVLDIDNGQVEFQYNFYRTQGEKEHLLERIYYHADSLATLREGMFAGRYFDDVMGNVKLVFYPALGQTQPSAN